MIHDKSLRLACHSHKVLRFGLLFNKINGKDTCVITDKSNRLCNLFHIIIVRS